MIPIPIIMPISGGTKKVNCIIQEGIRYCENQPITKSNITTSSFGVVGVFVWFGFWFWLMTKVDKKYNNFGLVMITMFGGGFVLPALIVGIVSLII